MALETPDVTVDAHHLARRLIVGTLVAELVLFALNYIFNFYDVAGDISVRRIFNVAREVSIPTFFASLQAVAVGATAIALRHTTDDRIERRGWMIVAVFWTYVGIDDNAEIHERVGSALGRATADSDFLSAWPGFSWQIFLAPVLALALFVSTLVAARYAPAGRAMLVACLACFAIAQGIDFLEGIDGQFDEWAADLGVAPYTVGHGLRSIEELLEMLGTTAFWSVSITLLATRLSGHTIKFADARPSSDG